MVKLQEYTADYHQEVASKRKWLVKLSAPSKNPKEFLLKNKDSSQPPVFRKDVFEFFNKYEGKYPFPSATEPGTFDQKDYYSLVPSATGYIRAVKIRPISDKQQFPNIEFFLQDPEDDEFFKITSSLGGSFSNHLCINLNHPDADFSKPFTFSFYKRKNDKKEGEFYLNTKICQSHLPPRNGFPGTLFINTKGLMPRSRDGSGNPIDDWYAEDWKGLLQFFGDKYQGTPLREGLVAMINEKAIAVFGHPPSEEEMIALNAKASAPDEDNFYDDSQDDEGHTSIPPVIPQSISTPAPTVSPHQLFGSIPSAPVAAPAPTQTVVHGNSLLESATIVAPPGSGEQSEAEKLEQLITQAGWSPVTVNSFYGLFGATNNLTLITAGNMNAAIAYVQDMIDFYEAAASLNPAYYGSINKPYGDWAIGIFTRKELVQVAGVKEAIEIVKKLVDIPF